MPKAYDAHSVDYVPNPSGGPLDWPLEVTLFVPTLNLKY